jgi:hypothetical protein
LFTLNCGFFHRDFVLYERMDRSCRAQCDRNEATNRHLDDAANKVNIINNARAAELRKCEASHAGAASFVTGPRAVIELDF